ncbi:D-alanine--D-alanine ligase [Zooshikella ganghwensis]|uniref:D-alanine--D-alanine ligase n=1 Tax=Zooshikella ganghwensis TaxID=202772 RepID=A0A4P9VT62_9GAMM|nr:D-alanine--D-alanine ligase [Zooshikella ganghwensis]RDH45422.1 D-alanine--D-alanine ligase [Zooshikella ganghwensis]
MIDVAKAVITPEEAGRIVVLYGGHTAEREISLLTGQAIYNALVQQGFDAFLLDVDEKNLRQQLSQQTFDRAFVALHGRFGEDGTIQGLLEMFNIPYTGSGVLASALAMDKFRSKLVWQGLGLPTPPYQLFRKGESQSLTIDLPCILKPVHEGSSVGMTKVKSCEELQSALKKAYQFDEQVLAETWVTGREFTVTILHGEALPAIELKTPREFYDYEAKYTTNDTQYICPCELENEQRKQLTKLALEAFSALGCEGWGRVDIMQDEANNFWLLEVNTIPGMTTHSLVPKAAKVAGIDFNQLVMSILATSKS